MRQAFFFTLIDHAQTWFNNLVEGIISSFEQVRREFIKSFIINSQQNKDAIYLFNIQQGSKETLRQYVDQFKNATLEI